MEWEVAGYGSDPTELVYHQRGLQAFRAGVSREACPYDRTSKAGKAWVLGHEDGRMADLIGNIAVAELNAAKKHTATETARAEAIAQAGPGRKTTAREYEELFGEIYVGDDVGVDVQ